MASFSLVFVTLGRDSIKHSIDSFKRQELEGRKEIVVVNNSSLPIKVDGVDKLVNLSTNIGAAAGRNLGAKVAKGDYLFFLDDDAVMDSSSTAKELVSILESSSYAVAATAKSVLPSGKPIFSELPSSDKSIVDRELALTPYFFTMGAVVDRNKFLASGGFLERFVVYQEEVDLSFRFFKNNYSMFYTSKSVVVHRREHKRDKRYWFLNSLNRIQVAWRHFPSVYVVSNFVLWSVILLLKTGSLSLWKSMVEKLRLLYIPLSKERNPLGYYEVVQLKRLGARFIF